MKKQRIKFEGPTNRTSLDLPNTLIEDFEEACRVRKMFKNAAIVEALQQWIASGPRVLGEPLQLSAKSADLTREMEQLALLADRIRDIAGRLTSATSGDQREGEGSRDQKEISGKEAKQERKAIKKGIAGDTRPRKKNPPKPQKDVE